MCFFNSVPKSLHLIPLDPFASFLNRIFQRRHGINDAKLHTSSLVYISNLILCGDFKILRDCCCINYCSY